MKKTHLIVPTLILAGVATYCGSSSSTSTSSCTQSANTTASGTTTAAISGSCALLTRDVSSCKTAREAQGLTGTNWMNFSCRVTITKSGSDVTIVTDSQPDYSSTYFSTTSACYTKQTTTYANPNTLSAQSISMTVPFAPTSTANTTMGGGPVGVALNGVVIYNQVANGTDNIYDEIGSFDYCQGHPQVSGQYHYHSEPYAISSSDSKLIGVARDGYFIYGRNDSNGTLATGAGNGTWDSAHGGHVGTPPTVGTSIFHYHAHLLAGTNTAGSTVNAYFLVGNTTTTSANYYGAPGACTGCN